MTIKNFISGLILLLASFSMAMSQTSSGNNDTISVLVKSVDRLIKLNADNNIRLIQNKKIINLAGNHFEVSKNSALNALCVTGLGLFSSYFLNKTLNERISDGNFNNKGLKNTINVVGVTSAAISVGFTIKSFVNIGKAGFLLKKIK